MSRKYWVMLAILAAALSRPQPSWALIDGLVNGARAVKDEAHQRIIENQMIQLVIEAKKNYDASMKIHQEIKRLNEGKGLVKNVSSDLNQRAKAMGQQEKESFVSDLTYRNNSGIDRYLQDLDGKAQSGISKRGFRLLDRYGNAIDQKSAAYAKGLKDQGERLFDRKKRGEASRQEGVKIASMAPDLNAKAQGLELQSFSDSVEALNELVTLQLARDAKDKRGEVLAEKEIAEALRFLSDRQGVSKILEESFFLVRLSRVPGLLFPTRKSISHLAGLLLGLFLAAGLLYEFSQTRGLVPELIGLPLVLVVFGLVFYDKIFVSFAVSVDALEQTISSGSNAAQSVFLASSSVGISDYVYSGSSWALKYLCMALGCLTWIIVIVFLWVRFAFFCLLYAIGPLLIVFALFEPLREMTKGWMKAVVQLGLWGLLMRILVLVIANSGVSALADPSGGPLKNLFASLVMDCVFLFFSIICPYFSHQLISGHIAEKALGTVTAGKASLLQAHRALARTQEGHYSRREGKK